MKFEKVGADTMRDTDKDTTIHAIWLYHTSGVVCKSIILGHISWTDRRDIPDTGVEFVLRENGTRMTRIGRIFAAICQTTENCIGRVWVLQAVVDFSV